MLFFHLHHSDADLVMGKQRKTVTNLCKNWGAFLSFGGDDNWNYKRFIACIVLYVVPCKAIYLCALRMQAGQGGYQLLIITTVHAKPPHLFCTAQSLICSTKFSTSTSSSGLYCIWEMHATNCKCEKQLISKPVATQAYTEVLVLHIPNAEPNDTMC